MIFPLSSLITLISEVTKSGLKLNSKIIQNPNPKNQTTSILMHDEKNKKNWKLEIRLIIFLSLFCNTFDKT